MFCRDKQPLNNSVTGPITLDQSVEDLSNSNLESPGLPLIKGRSLCHITLTEIRNLCSFPHPVGDAAFQGFCLEG